MRLRLKGSGRVRKPELPDRDDLLVFGGYCLAAAVYIAIGVAYINFLLSFWVGLGYLLLVAWLVPAAVRRFG